MSKRRMIFAAASMVVALTAGAIGATTSPAAADNPIGPECQLSRAWTNHYWSVHAVLVCTEPRLEWTYVRFGGLGQTPTGEVTTKQLARRAGGPYGLKRCTTTAYHQSKTVKMTCAVPLKPWKPKVSTCFAIGGTPQSNGKVINVHRDNLRRC